MMKSEPKPFASLSSGLLARKGAARPAMRPQGFGQAGSGLEDLGWNDMGFDPPKPALSPVEGSPLAPRINPAAGLSPASPVHAVQEELAQRLVHEGEDEADETAEVVAADAPPLAAMLAEVRPEPAPVTEPAPVSEPGPAPQPVPQIRIAAERAAPKPRAGTKGKGKAAFTLRLDAERHLKLRLACAMSAKSAQQLVTRALDELLATMPELNDLAARSSDRKASKG